MIVLFTPLLFHLLKAKHFLIDTQAIKTCLFCAQSMVFQETAKDSKVSIDHSLAAKGDKGKVNIGAIFLNFLGKGKTKL